MSKKGFSGGAHKPGASTGAGAAAADAALLEKLCELLEAETVNNEAVLACLAELKLLTAANNDALALAEILSAIEELCKKQLQVLEEQSEANELLEGLCEKLQDTIAELSSLCEKVASGNEEIVSCLKDIKEATASVISALEALCDKQDKANELLDTANQSLQSVCDKLEKIASILDSLAQSNTAENLAIVECLVELKALNTAGNALSEQIQSELQQICDKLLEGNESNQAICDKLEKLLELTQSFQQSNTSENEAILECLRESKELTAVPVCLTRANGSTVSAVAHYNYSAKDASANAPVITDVSLGKIYDLADFASWSSGSCEVTEQCVESQEWTYGIDNTGTNFRWPDADYELELSDGSTIQFSQSTSANGGWTPQMQEWGANIQAAADQAGLQWFVETRYRNPANIDSLAGGGGFAGPPSVAISRQLTGMLWRYVNIQICPGQPVPVGARLLRVNNAGGQPVPALPFELTTNGAVLGPLQKFWICKQCGNAPVWYLADGETLAEAGQVPNCYEPCGVLTLADDPPDRQCQFEFIVACDDNGQDDLALFTNDVTRRATICNGEKIEVSYFVEDPDDPTALIDYSLQGSFVDCSTGQPIEEPKPIYEDIEKDILCEIDARFLLLIDSNGGFARYSFYTKRWTNVSVSGITSAGGSADVDNFLLYNFVAPDILTVVDVNSDTRLADVTVTNGIIKPGLASNPLTFSAASFRDSDGLLYSWDTGGADAGLYRTNPQTGVIDFVTTISGVAGAGTSIAIDNSTDTLYINGSGGRVYQVDWVTGVGTQVGTAPIAANGSTFDRDGNLYVTANTDTYVLAAGLDGNDPANWVQIIDDWAPGANSMAYYETLAANPSCFERRVGFFADGTSEVIGDFNVADNTPRTIVGEIDCCGCK